jgi:hypothetical protein
VFVFSSSPKCPKALRRRTLAGASGWCGTLAATRCVNNHLPLLSSRRSEMTTKKRALREWASRRRVDGHTNRFVRTSPSRDGRRPQLFFLCPSPMAKRRCLTCASKPRKPGVSGPQFFGGDVSGPGLEKAFIILAASLSPATDSRVDLRFVAIEPPP